MITKRLKPNQLTEYQEMIKRKEIDLIFGKGTSIEKYYEIKGIDDSQQKQLKWD